MLSLPVLRRVPGGVERLDAPGADPALVADALDDLRRLNAVLSGTRLTLGAIGDLCGGLGPGPALTLLDVGCGGGDVAASVVAAGARRGRRIYAIAVDASPAIAAHARTRHGAVLDVRVGDVRALDLADGSVDVATCSLLLHHLEPPDAVRALVELRRVARVGVVVNDLVRSVVGLVGAHVLVRAGTRNPLTRYDAVLSVRRAYSHRELHELLNEAALRPVRTRRALGYRVAVAAVAA